MDLEKLVRPEIWALAAYKSARSELSDAGNMIQLDANESPYAPYPADGEAIGLNRYPDPQPKALVATLASIYGVNNDQILITRGMDEGIDLMIRSFCVPGQDSIVITTPTFGYYQVAADVSAVKVIGVPLSEDENFATDAKKVLAACRENTKIILLCSPNNPTGTTVPLATILEIAKAVSDKSIVAIDEAYIEFSEDESALKLLSECPNLVVMRTLSKAYALAGARLGVVIAGAQIIALLRKVIPPYPIPTPTTRAVLKALSPFGLNMAAKNIVEIKQERERLEKLLKKSKEILKVYPSEGNFLLIKVEDGQKFYKKLLAQGIVIRSRHSDIPNTLRLSIGTPKENNLLLAALGLIDNPAALDQREALITRKSNETEIMIHLNLDQTAPISIHTGIGFYDHMLEQLAKHGGISMDIKVIGDTHIDAHHTVEDVAIVLGQAFKKALGDKKGIGRYGFTLPMDETLAMAAIDLSGRSAFEFEANFPAPMLGDLPTEMVRHFFLSLSENLGAAIHIKAEGENTHHMVEGCFKAFAKALKQAVKKEGNDLPSTKGML